MHRALIFLCITVLFCSSLWAQTEPSTRISLPEGPMKIKITGVTGKVQARKAADQKWEPAAEGLELAEGAELRTGPRSAVQFMIGDDQTITLDRLGTIQILKANFESGKVFTDLGMKYGRTRYDIDSAAREHDAKVRSPSSVLAVRGTKFSAYDQPPFAPEAVSLQGRVLFRDAKKLAAVGSKNGGKAKIDTEHDSAAAKALDSTFFSPDGDFAGSVILQQKQLHAAQAKQFNTYGVAVLFDLARQKPPSALDIAQRQTLDIRITWSGSSSVSMSVLSPFGETLDEANPRVPSLGHFSQAQGNTLSLQTAEWNVGFPIGRYSITSVLNTGAPVDVTLDVTRFDPQTSNNQNQTVTFPPIGGKVTLDQSGSEHTKLFTLDGKNNPSEVVKVDATAAPQAPSGSEISIPKAPLQSIKNPAVRSRKKL